MLLRMPASRLERQLILGVCVSVLAGITAPTAHGQDAPPAASTVVPRSWQRRLDATLVAGLFVRPVTLTLVGAERPRATGLLGEFGLRTSPIAALCGTRPGATCRVLSKLTVAPHASLGATHLRGIEARAGQSSFSTFELLGVRVAYPVTKRVVPYALFRRGKHASEQFEGNDVVNLWGPGTTMGAGLDVPITTLGRGVSIAVTQQRGTFESIETRDVLQNRKVIGTTSRAFKATSWQIGWSGPFTGVTWPWQ